MGANLLKLSDRARIICSEEVGRVIGIAEYEDRTLRDILLRYRAADGRAVQAWWSEDALEGLSFA